ncbi:ArsR family transcriptional regulator [Haladaptatus sp. CMAA 1911]|uniref:DUF7344 domain-containing protein n=1 Tax=unclassified Haladaptatus TaxID=2622732 RepID=UPI0037548015
MSNNAPSSNTSLDIVLDALANTYRRRLLTTLLEHNPQHDEDTHLPLDVSIADEDVEQLKVHMIHIHLPKLEDTGLIEWDRDTNEIRRGPQFEELRPFLQLMQDHADELPDDWL